MNKAATLSGSLSEPFNITQINNLLIAEIDGRDVIAQLPIGGSVSAQDVADAINLTSDPEGFVVSYSNELKAAYSGHIADATCHLQADSTNVISAANAVDIVSAITLLNDIKSVYNAHIADTDSHTAADNVNVVTAADASDIDTAVTLLGNLLAQYAGHISDTSFHQSEDITNTVSGSDGVAGVTADGCVVLKSQKTNASSVISLSSSSTAISVLGFQPGVVARRTQPTASDIAAALNNNTQFSTAAFAFAVTSPGIGSFVQIESKTTGIGSRVGFTQSSAFTEGTGFGIVPSTSGDTGEDAQSGFRVTSDNPVGSFGTGTPGQTYTDARTGLRFTILKPSAGDYDDGGKFTFSVSRTFTASGSFVVKSVPGVDIVVTNTTGVEPGNTATVSTFNKSGNEPDIGDIYNISYTYRKTDFSPRLYRNIRDVQATFGPSTPEYPLSLAARIAMLNGAVLLGLKQVPSSSGSNSNAFVDAIEEFRRPIEGQVKPDVIVPLSTDPYVFNFLNQHCVFMSSERQEGERIGVIGPAVGTTPLGMRTIATSLRSELIVATYPDQWVVSITDQFNNTVDQVVDGTYMAAALAGSSCNPTIDVATPWTRRDVFGFKSAARQLDPTEANQVAVAGVSVVEPYTGGMRIRHGLTTKTDNVITRTPSVVLTMQLVQQAIRATLDPYVGQKFTGTLLRSAEQDLLGLFDAFIDSKIITKLVDHQLYIDENDPTIMRVEAVYVPVFPLEWIVAALQVRVRA